MKEFIIGEKIVKVPTEWSEITLKKYLEIAKLENIKNTFAFEELYLMKVIEVLCDCENGDMDEMTMEQVNEIAELLKFMGDLDNWKILTHICIDDVYYVFPSDLNKLTMGEYISIKTLQEKMGDTNDSLPYMLAVILRPGRKIEDPHTKKERWIQDKFDIEGIEYRKDLFLSQPISNLMGAINFFLGGKEMFMSSTKDSMGKVRERVD